MAPYGPLLAFMRPYGPLMTVMGPYGPSGPLWALMSVTWSNFLMRQGVAHRH